MSNHGIVETLCHSFQKGDIDGVELRAALLELKLPEMTVGFLVRTEIHRKVKRNANRKRPNHDLSGENLPGSE